MANSDFEKCDEYPSKRFHEKMSGILEEIEYKHQELPLLFSIPLDEEISFLDFTYCYNFIVMDKALFRHTKHEFDSRCKERELALELWGYVLCGISQSVFNCSANIGRASTKGNE